MTPSTLIRDLEAATEGGRELDAEIYLLEWPGCYLDKEPGYIWQPGAGSINSMTHRAPAYTTSLDAALTLVPEGWRVVHIGQDGESWYVELGFGPTGHGEDYSPYQNAVSRASTPALALCIAALKAMGVEGRETPAP